MPPQVFKVLRCYKCEVFQVHQVKKSNKWQCKMCGEKQSIKRNYGIGTAKECRKHVQKLNGVRGEMSEGKGLVCESETEEEDDESPKKPSYKVNRRKSKWSNYVSEDSDEEQNVAKDMQDEMYLDDCKVVLEVPNKKRKTNYNKAKSYLNKRYYNKKTKCETSESDSENNPADENPCVETVDIKLKKKQKFDAPFKKEETVVLEGFQENKFYGNTPQTFSYNENDNCSRDINNPIKVIPRTNVVKAENHSKWAKFVEEDVNENPDDDDEDDNGGEDEFNQLQLEQKPVHSKIKNMGQSLFSQTDDKDLDNIFNF